MPLKGTGRARHELSVQWARKLENIKGQKKCKSTKN